MTFTGSWDAHGSEASAFSLDLTQTGNRIRGYHIAVTPHGRRIDAALPEDGPTSITGTVTASAAHVRFQSAYDESGHGEAILTLRGNKLDWKITRSSGAHYLPMSSVLERRKKHETASPHQAMRRFIRQAPIQFRKLPFGRAKTRNREQCLHCRYTRGANRPSASLFRLPGVRTQVWCSSLTGGAGPLILIL